jgi:hypothetical protein
LGAVDVTRLAYRRRGQANLCPADAALNLPRELHSHGLRELSAIESSRGSFEDASDAIRRVSGVRLGKRQLEQLAARAAADFEAFYCHPSRNQATVTEGDLLILSADGKGHRDETRRVAARHRQGSRPSHRQAGDPTVQGREAQPETNGRGRCRLRPDTTDPDPNRHHRARRRHAPASCTQGEQQVAHRERGRGRATVICSIFDEAQRRDPTHQRTWVALVDGAKHQIDRIQAEARARHVQVTIVCDFIHVLEYLWSAAWSFFTEGDPAPEKWISKKALAVLNGQASTVAAAIRRKATTLGLDPHTRRGADRCADYLLAKRDYLNYPQALEQGWPIATGIIEGACRHLVKDRLDLTGARWGLQGAEAILKLRALRSNGDFEQYWTFHLNQELHQVHETRYADMTLATAA